MDKIEPEPESWNRLRAVRGEKGGGYCLKEGEEISQRTCMNDPWTWNWGEGWVDGGEGGKIRTSVTA